MLWVSDHGELKTEHEAGEQRGAEAAEPRTLRRTLVPASPRPLLNWPRTGAHSALA